MWQKTEETLAAEPWQVSKISEMEMDRSVTLGLGDVAQQRP